MMGLIEAAIRRWQITLVLFLALTALGTSAYITIPRSVDPHFSAPLIGVIVTSPGAEPADMEAAVARPIEDLLQGLDGIVKVSSRSTDSVAQISAEFSWDGNPEKHYDEVVREVNALRGSLPSSVQDISVQRFRTSDAAVLQLALVSDTASYRRLEKYAKDLRERLNRVNGVRLTTTWAIPNPEARVAIDAGKLAQLNLPVSAVTNALGGASIDLAAGAVHSGDQRLNVQAGGAFRELAEIAELPIRVRDGQLALVKDVAVVGWDYAEQMHLARFNGHRAIWVTLNQKDNYNVLEVRRDALATVEDFRKLLPPDVQLEIGFDQSFDISDKLNQLGRDFAIALAIVLLTLLPLGWRASAVVMVSVPLSLAIGCAALAALGFTLNELSISGFIIALGLLVDDSIVVTENIARHLREGKDRETAALDGTRQVAVAVLGCTCVLLFAFLPLAFLPEAAGSFVRSLPVAVLGTVAASLVVAVTIVPFLASRLLQENEQVGGSRLLRQVERAIHRGYTPLLHYSLDNPWRATGISVLIAACGLGLTPLLGSSLFPEAETPYFLIEVNGPPGAALQQTDRAVRFVEQTLRREPEVANVLANVGRSNPRVFYNSNSFEQRSNIGGVLVVLKRWDPVAGPALVESLRQRFADYAEADLVVRTFQKGPPIDAPIVIKIFGPEIGQLKIIAAHVETVMSKITGTQDIKNSVAADFPRISLDVDIGKAALLGVDPGAPRQALRLSLAGEPAGRIRDREGDTYNVMVRLPLTDRHAVSDLNSVYVPGRFGAVSLREIATPKLESAPVSIDREGQQRIAYVKSQVATGFLTTDVNRAVFEAVNQIDLPEGYRFEVGGEAEQARKSFGGLGPVVTLALFGILAVLVIEFGSFRETIVVAGVVPFGISGGLAALFLTGNSLSFTAVIGFVALIGIEIKNSILLVDFTTQLRRTGMGLRDAIERAGEVRFLPVLLTSITAIGGLLPLALSGSELYGPLAWVIIGGLVSSTLLARVVTPTMYMLIMRGQT
jgi:multidrug efflux pump subunit AcrB